MECYIVIIFFFTSSFTFIRQPSMKEKKVDLLVETKMMFRLRCILYYISEYCVIRLVQGNAIAYVA